MNGKILMIRPRALHAPESPGDILATILLMGLCALIFLVALDGMLTSLTTRPLPAATLQETAR